MSKYTLETKIAAVYAYVDGAGSFKQTAKKYYVSRTMLNKWVAKFRKYGITAFQETYAKYSVEFKMDVLNYIDEMGASIEEAAVVFNVPTSSTVWNCERLFELQGIDALQPKAKGRPPMKKDRKKNPTPKTADEALRAENEQLRMENAYLKKLHALIQEKQKSQNKTKRK